MSVNPPERNSPTESRSPRPPSLILADRESIPERSPSISSSVSRSSKTTGSTSNVSGLRSLQRKLTGKVSSQRESLEANINGGRAANGGVWSKFTGGGGRKSGGVRGSVEGRKEFALVQQRGGGNLDSILAISAPAESQRTDAYEFLESTRVKAPAFPSGPRLSPRPNNDVPPPSPDFTRQPSEPSLSSLRARNPHRHTPILRRDSNILPSHLAQKPSAFQSTSLKINGSDSSSAYSSSPNPLAAPFEPLEHLVDSTAPASHSLHSSAASSRDVLLASGRLASSIRSSQLQSSLNDSYNKNRTSLIDSFGSGGQIASRAVGAAGLEGRKVALQKSAERERKNYWENPPEFPRLPFANDAPDLPPPSLISRMREENGNGGASPMQTRRMTFSPSPEPTHALPPLPTLPTITHHTSMSPHVAEFVFADDQSDATEEIENDILPQVVVKRRSYTPGLPVIPARSSYRLSGTNFSAESKSSSPVSPDHFRAADVTTTFLPSLLPPILSPEDIEQPSSIELEEISVEEKGTEVDEEVVLRGDDAGDSSELEISVREMQLEILRMQEELSTPTATSFDPPSPDDPSLLHPEADDSNLSTSSQDESTGKRWSIIEVELAYERMKMMLQSSGKSGVSESGVSELGDAEGALERALRDSSMENYSSLPGFVFPPRIACFADSVCS